MVATSIYQYCGQSNHLYPSQESRERTVPTRLKPAELALAFLLAGCNNNPYRFTTLQEITAAAETAASALSRRAGKGQCEQDPNPLRFASFSFPIRGLRMPAANLAKRYASSQGITWPCISDPVFPPASCKKSRTPTRQSSSISSSGTSCAD